MGEQGPSVTEVPPGFCTPALLGDAGVQTVAAAARGRRAIEVEVGEGEEVVPNGPRGREAMARGAHCSPGSSSVRNGRCSTDGVGEAEDVALVVVEEKVEELQGPEA